MLRHLYTGAAVFNWQQNMVNALSLLDDRPLPAHPLPTDTGLRIEPVRNALERRSFIDLPWRIYRDDPHWVPPLKLQVAEFIAPSHPFRQHGTAQEFVAWRNQEPVGRVLVSDDPRFNESQGTNSGCFGMFESINDQETADLLLAQAAAWLGNRGRTEIIGPIDYSMNYTAGLLVDGFDTPPRVLMNHHPPYYTQLLENAGLSKSTDLYAWWFTDHLDMLSQWRDRLDALASRFGIRIRPIDCRNLQSEIRLCKEIYDETWQNSWGFVKMTDAEFDHMARELVRLGWPELMLIAEVHDRPVGLCITLPDLNEAIRPLDGRLTRWGMPIGLARLMWRMRHIKTARMALLGVVEGYRRRGVAELLILKTLDYGKHVLHFDAAELSWTLECNTLINRTIERVGGKRYKTYRIYRKDITMVSRYPV